VIEIPYDLKPKIDDFLNIGVQVSDEVELNIGLKESSIDLVETIMEDCLVDNRWIAHLLESTWNAPC